MIGSGVFELGEPLELSNFIELIGAGKSGSKRTELVTQPGVETAISMTEGNSTGRSIQISDLSIKNVGETEGSAFGIHNENNFLCERCSFYTIRNVSVEVSGGIIANTGIRAGIFPTLENVDVSVNAGGTALGVWTNCVQAAGIEVVVRASNETQSATGWLERSDDCRLPVMRQFSIDVRGGVEAIGLHITDRGFESVAEGSISVPSGTAVLGSEGEAYLSDVVISANIGIDNVHSDFVLDDVVVRAADKAIKMGDSSVTVMDSTLIGQDYGVWTDTDQNSVRIDGSTVSGRVNSVFAHPVGRVNIGTSRLVGPISVTNGSLTCVFVYDENYAPVTCP
jgi:hypothetical protein